MKICQLHLQAYIHVIYYIFLILKMDYVIPTNIKFANLIDQVNQAI